jgi:thiamine kinase-like enzyme
MKSFSLLELLHPDGTASISIVLGSNCPEALLPERQEALDQKAALLIIAPSARECQSEGWLEKSANFVNHHLADDGVCYVLVPIPWRWKMIRLLSRLTLVIDASFWHFPDWASSQYLVPLHRGPVSFAVENIIYVPRWKQMIARQLFGSSAVRGRLGSFWKSAAISVRRPNARPLFQWLSNSNHGKEIIESAIIRQSWRGLRGASILYCFPEREALPSAIAKLASVENYSVCLEREVEALEALGPSARSAGMQVPQILLKLRNNAYSSLILSPLRGRPVSDLLASNSNLLSPLLTKIVEWLKGWHISTINLRPLNVEWLAQNFCAPLERLLPFLQNAQEYQSWLIDRIQTAVGTPLPLVSAHNDLTMANILVEEPDVFGVVDWETGLSQNWPLVDFYYAVTDAVRIAQGYTDWLEAFKACYEAKGAYTRDVHRWEEALRSAIDLSPALTELCFHACWLHHASNEHEVSQPGDPRPFLAIVQWLALNYSRSNEN